MGEINSHPLPSWRKKSMPIILETKQITKRFGELAAVNNLSFDVNEKEIFGIAGPNGAGKTTLFNVISGIYSGSGEIDYFGERIDRLRPFQVCLKGIARTFQIPTVFSTLTVYDNIRIGAHFGNHSLNEKKIINDVLEFIGLTEKQHIEAKHLPLFDKKLTMLGAALATEPKLILLDEPIGGLSPKEINESVELFKRINNELGITIIVIEHLMKVLMAISQRMMIIHNGEKICIGSPEEVARDKQVIEVYLGAEYA
ncbi:MAG TPA: ABC transporter ATP-binding protein [Anaerolineae bacterium]|nr:ABC transporter ATP-binding protein [Anaerolineae bacterium]HCC78765.1 ABC transporter ATP-binding protein [Anaerolineae bacterium]HCM96516.1 ABC transporter ATP-binding protein [Anaerolineae bacterium]